MAEGVSTGQLLSKAILGHLECSICCTRYDQPKNLDCSHSFCLKCLQELKKTQHPEANKLTCPLCQKKTSLPRNGVAGLQNNYPLNAMVEEVNRQEQLLQGEELKVMCQACDEKNAAISRCKNCEHYLCRVCQKAHKRFPALKHHEIKTLAESKMDISRCDVHPFQESCLYCMTCEQLACKLCADLCHKQPMHNIVALNMAFDISQDTACKTDSQLHQSNFKMEGQLPAMRKRLKCLFHETNDNISHHAEQKINKIRREEMHLKQKAKALYQRKDKKLAELEFAEQTMKTIRTHSKMTNVNRLQVLKNRQEVLHNYKDVNAYEDVTYDLSFIAFCKAENEVEIGTLLHKEKWELMSEVDHKAGLVSSYHKDSIIAVCQSQVDILRPNGKALNTILQFECKDLCNPTAIAVNNKDQLIVLDSPSVKTFNKEFQLLNEFTPREPGCEPTCLAVDENNLIAVGYSIPRGGNGGPVSLYNPDGSLIRLLPALDRSGRITMNNHRIIYTYRSRLTGVDYQGKNIIEQVETGSASGVCTCDKAGDIYVLYSDRIQHLSASGTHVEWIHLDKTHEHTSITFTQNGELAVQSDYEDKITIYHRV